MTFKILILLSAIWAGTLPDAHADDEEPTVLEMKEALLYAMAASGGQRTDKNQIEGNNKTNGSAINIMAFKKEGCRKRTVDFVCQYSGYVAFSAHDNAGEETGGRHAVDVSAFLLATGIGNFPIKETRVFYKSQTGRWIVSTY